MRAGKYSRTSLANGFVAQVILGLAPVHRRRTVEAEGCLIVDVDALGNVCERQHVDVVAGLGQGRLHSRRLDEAREAFSIALDGRVYPVADRNIRTSVREAGVDITRDGVDSGCVSAGGKKSAEKHRAARCLHGEAFGRRYCLDAALHSSCSESRLVMYLAAFCCSYIFAAKVAYESPSSLGNDGKN